MCANLVVHGAAGDSVGATTVLNAALHCGERCVPGGRQNILRRHQPSAKLHKNTKVFQNIRDSLGYEKMYFWR